MNKCGECGKPTSNKHYCSRTCGAHAAQHLASEARHRASLDAIKQKSHPCESCGSVTANTRFCSRNCSAHVTNHESPRRQSEQGKKYGYCAQCGESLRSFNIDYCGRACYEAAWVAEWVAGTLSEDLLPSNQLARRVLRKMYHNACQECEWSVVSKWNGQVTLTLEHQDGNPSNNLFENLKLLCANCHTLTENFCGRNTTASRAKRGRPPVPVAAKRTRRRYRAAHMNSNADVV